MKRTRLETGIYQDAYGVSAVVKVRGVQREKHFPLDVDLEVLRQWRADTRALLLKDTLAAKAQRADARTIARSIVAYLKRRKGRVSYESDRSHLKAWLPFFRHRRRHQITRGEVQAVIGEWSAAGVKPATIRHRVRVLRELYQALDGESISHPLQHLELPAVERSTPIPVSHATIQAVAESLKKGKRHAKGYGDDPTLSRARFLVYATTGQRPAQIGRAKPADVDLARRLWFVRPAKGGNPIPLPLSDQMVRAWEFFIAAKAWGPFDPSSLAKLLRRHGWPEGVRPYMLRHTFAIDLLLGGADLGDVQGLLGHTDIRTTRTFYAPILLARLTSAVERRVLPSAVLPSDDASGRANAPQNAPRRTRSNAKAAKGKTKKSA